MAFENIVRKRENAAPFPTMFSIFKKAEIINLATVSWLSVIHVAFSLPQSKFSRLVNFFPKDKFQTL